MTESKTSSLDLFLFKDKKDDPTFIATCPDCNRSQQITIGQKIVTCKYCGNK